jgi:hypothetical protein
MLSTEQINDLHRLYWSERWPKPFAWTAKASDILEKVKRARKVLNDD